MIAQQLRDRYPLFHLWHYSSVDYLKSKSQNKCSKRRLKILENIKDPKLKEISGWILETDGVLGYQENIIKEYINDIEKYALEQY